MISINSILWHSGIDDGYGSLENPTDIGWITRAYNEGHRHYHNMNHIKSVIDKLEEMRANDVILTERDFQMLLVAAVFHDIVYDPTNKTNEIDSANIWRNSKRIKFAKDYWDFNELEVEIIAQIIENSNPLIDLEGDANVRQLSLLFRRADCSGLESTKKSNLIYNERAIFKEFQFYDWPLYKEGRIRVLNQILARCCEFAENPNVMQQNIEMLMAYVDAYEPNIGFYPGSFDPFHIGHCSILKRAESLFDKVIIGIGSNPSKEGASDSLAKRVHDIKQIIPYHQIECFSGLLTDHLESLNYPVTLIRGLRTDTDFRYEEVQLRLMQDMMPELNVVFIPCDKRWEHVSSSAIRAIKSMKNNEPSMYECSIDDIYVSQCEHCQ